MDHLTKNTLLTSTGIDFDQIIWNLDELLKNTQYHNLIVPGHIHEQKCLALWPLTNIRSWKLKRINLGIYINHWPHLDKLYLNLFIWSKSFIQKALRLRSYDMNNLNLDKVFNKLIDISVTLDAIDQFLS
jgi:hypothetical protein